MDVPWLRDPCPPAPFLDLGIRVRAGVVEVVPGVLAAGGPGWAEGRAGIAPRARAVALGTALRDGVLVRVTAAWVWLGDPGLRPGPVRVAPAPGRPVTTGRVGSRHPARAPVLSPVRWCSGGAWVRVGGVAVTDPTTTAEECLRLERGERARLAVVGLLRSGLTDAAAVRTRLDAQRGHRGRTSALDRLDRLDEHADAAPGAA
ncbi:hypothetical protein [Aquipuribacter nitratireducens]|uniref:Transcriptional regulator with AbiEi antitoxin domain of type IV toxin-antitoxin system n=1 Tax=Aquipuribacter nitratireducens TaxID=650104 RepID=A0ABW0GSF2_9MICO